MRFKGTLVLLIAFIIFGGYIYFYEIKGGEQREKAKQAENQLWKLEDKNIVRIDILYPSSRITAERTGDRTWALTSPQAWDADAAEINRLAASSTTLKRERIVEQNASDLGRFGLNPAQFGLRLKMKNGQEFGIDFGNANPTGEFNYAVLTGTKDVFLIQANAAGSFNKKIEDVRDRTILKFERTEVQSLSIKNSKGTIDIYKDGSDRWWFKGAEKRAADGPEVRGLLIALALGKAAEFFNENITDYANTGLDKPLIDVRMEIGPNKIKHFSIGTEKTRLQKKASVKTADKAGAPSTELYLAKDDSRSFLFFVDKELVDKLSKSAGDIREKALVSFQRWDVDSISLVNAKGSFNFSRKGGEWFFAGSPRKAKWEAVNNILDALEKPVREWIDTPAPLASYGLDKPLVHVVLKQGNAVLADCAFGNSSKNGGIFARVKGDVSIKVADPEGFDSFNKTEADYFDALPVIPAKK